MTGKQQVRAHALVSHLIRLGKREGHGASARTMCGGSVEHDGTREAVDLAWHRAHVILVSETRPPKKVQTVPDHCPLAANSGLNVASHGDQESQVQSAVWGPVWGNLIRKRVQKGPRCHFEAQLLDDHQLNPQVPHLMSAALITVNNVWAQFLFFFLFFI